MNYKIYDNTEQIETTNPSQTHVEHQHNCLYVWSQNINTFSKMTVIPHVTFTHIMQ